MTRLQIHGVGTMAVGHDEPFSPGTAMLDTLPIKEFVPPRKSRRFGRLSKMVYVAAMRALENARVANPAEIPVINATCVGETAASLGLLEQIHQTRGKVISPALVPNSVHNAPAGYLSIGLGNHAPSVTVSQGWLSSEAALAVASDWLTAGVSESVLVVSGDEADPAWIDRLGEKGASRLAASLESESFQEGAVAFVMGRDSSDSCMGSVTGGVERIPVEAKSLSGMLHRCGVRPADDAEVRVRGTAGDGDLRRLVAEALGRPLDAISRVGRGEGTAQAYAFNALALAVKAGRSRELLLLSAEVDEFSFVHWCPGSHAR